jgi:hypothetical protein
MMRPVDGKAIADGSGFPASILRDARLRRALRMRTEGVAASPKAKLPLSLILRRPRSGRLEASS